MPRIAFMTYGELHEPHHHPRVQGFIDRVEAVFAAAEATPGHIATAYVEQIDEALPNDAQDWGPWAPYRAPAFYGGTLAHDERTNAQTLSLWRDLESVYAFSYSGRHMEALRKRKEWFVKPAWPTYVAWWVADDHIPSWDEACSRLEQLHEHGPTSSAFGFRKAFDAAGKPYRLKNSGPAR